ncbi:MAG: tRNA preQ1(34) S-adenosylmethionine ribosyltransferase-isomerase QueA [Chthoniobacterales bacterium]
MTAIVSETLADYDYELPSDLIAARPLPRRDDSRMMCVDRKSGKIEHLKIADLPDLIEPGDLAVLNNSRVFRARTFSNDGRNEVFFIEPRGDGTWLAMVRPGRRMRVGDSCQIADVQVSVREILSTGERIVELSGPLDFEKVGELPLPPYMQRSADAEDDERYQCVFASEEGSVAAPTAGLHFTKEMLLRIPHCEVTLHVGPGTFRPVKTERLEDHVMHEERYILTDDAANKINAAKRILAVGTTSVRVLESQPQGPLLPNFGSTRIFIRPPYAFQRVDRLLTNFHLPASTLLMLVSAFAGRELILESYKKAIEERYRFFSYGDCMLIV